MAANAVVLHPRIAFSYLPVGASSRSAYRKKAAIATAGKTRQVRTTKIEGKNEAENNIVKFPMGMTQRLKMTVLQITIKCSTSKNF